MKTTFKFQLTIYFGTPSIIDSPGSLLSNCCASFCVAKIEKCKVQAGLSLRVNHSFGWCATLLERSIFMFSAILYDIDEPNRLVDKPHSELPWTPSLGSQCAPSRWSSAGAASAFASSLWVNPICLGLDPQYIHWDWQKRLGYGSVPLCRPYV